MLNKDGNDMAFENTRYTLGEYPNTVSWIGRGFNAIDNTVRQMQKIISTSARNPRVRDVAADIVKDVQAKDQYAEVDAIYNWVRDHTRYLRDIQGMEMLQSPLVALDMIDKGFAFQGDCDDLTMLTLSLIKSIGYPVQIRIAAYRGKSNFTHVYGLVLIYGVWMAIEPIQKDVMLGWEAPNMTKYKDYEVE